jgi:two-component system response regulator YesN
MNRPVYRVLVAEDEVMSRRALRLICERSASPVKVVSEASTGRQVVEALDVVRPDIILMDMVLPGMNALETTRVVRERSPSTRVALVAREQSDDTQRALRAGAVDCLLKPIRADQLEALLQKLCAGLDAEKTDRHCSSEEKRQARALAPQGPHAQVLQRARDFILAHYTEGLSLEEVAGQVALSPTYFSRIFKQAMGCTFVEYLTRVRLEEARHLLRTTTLSLAEISYAVGYQSPNYFSEVFKTVEGVTASAYRRSATASLR